MTTCPPSSAASGGAEAVRAIEALALDAALASVAEAPTEFLVELIRDGLTRALGATSVSVRLDGETGARPPWTPGSDRPGSAWQGPEGQLLIPLCFRGRKLGAVIVAGHPAGGDDDGSIRATLFRLGDLLAAALAQGERHESLEMQAAVLEATSAACSIPPTEGTIRWANQAVEASIGYDRKEIAGRTLVGLGSDLPPPALRDELAGILQAGRVWGGESRGRRKGGALFVERHALTPVTSASGQVQCAVPARQDPGKERSSRGRRRSFPAKDPLTGLPNRTRIEAILPSAVAEARRGTSSSLLVLDIDNFRAVNEAAGHAAGDRVLVEVARYLRSRLRQSDELARLDGDEFAVLLDGAGLEEGRLMAERLRAGLEYGGALSGTGSFPLSLSVGVVLIDGTAAAGDVLAIANSCVRAAKEAGRNRVVVGDRSALSRPALADASARAAALKDALRCGRLQLHLQPIVRLEDGRVTHHEALLRIEDENSDLQLPSDFLSAAERFGLMPRVDLWVLDQVLDLLVRDRSARLFMNLSASTLSDPDLLASMEKRVRASGDLAARLSFEITETAAVRSVPTAREWFRRVKSLGCRLALDDFGTGFSSFGYLQALPVDFLKIDGSFIRSVSRDRTNREIVKGVVAIARSLGKQVIAEAVEDPDDLAAIRDLQIEYGQGWILGKPGRADLQLALKP
jgi:diguanylate cyclase (GGDEF)-like protein/PAS domain S-box-containing protein